MSYKYRIFGQSYGGELVVGKTNPEFVRHWAPLVEDQGDDELIDYLTSWEETDEPEDALLDPEISPSPAIEDSEWEKGSWHALDHLEHINSVFADSCIRVVLLDESGEETDEETVYELDEVYGLYSRECYYSSDEPEDLEGYIPVVSVMSSEKGTFWNIELELEQPFEIELLTKGVMESNLCELVDTMFYDGKPLELDFSYADTIGKGFYAAVGWMKEQYHDTYESFTSEEKLKEFVEWWEDEVK